MTDEMRQFYTGKTVVVTGASGFIATNLVEALAGVECDVRRLSRELTLVPVVGAVRMSDYHGDIREPSVWGDVLPGCDIVFHFAAQTSVYVAEDNPAEDLRSNVYPMLNLLETCRKKSIKPAVIFAGTVTEAGIPEHVPVTEQVKDAPVTVYDMHKLWAEQYLLHYARQEIVNGTTLRLANVYGPGPRSSSADRGIITLMIRKALAGESLTIYGKGECLRDYVYVEDVVRAFLLAPVHMKKVNAGYFVIGSEQGHTIAEAINMVADTVAKRTLRLAEVCHIDSPRNLSTIESRNFVADCGAYRAATGWRATADLEEGIRRTVDRLVKDPKEI